MLLAFSFARNSAGSNSPARIPMTAMTTSNSISVNAKRIGRQRLITTTDYIYAAARISLVALVRDSKMDTDSFYGKDIIDSGVGEPAFALSLLPPSAGASQFV